MDNSTTSNVGELGRIARTLVDYARREHVTDPEVLRSIAELEDHARKDVADCGRPIDADDGAIESVTQYAERTATPARTVRRWCASGRLPAWGDGAWQIRQSSSAELDGSPQRDVSRAR